MPYIEQDGGGWEWVTTLSDEDIDTYRAPVEGGNLYLAVNGHGAMALTFVPRPVPRPWVMGGDPAAGEDRTVVLSTEVLACPNCFRPQSVDLTAKDPTCERCGESFGGVS